ncbi:MAG: hypothetical protein R3B40_11960 [Polyangiales bacterium]
MTRPRRSRDQVTEDDDGTLVSTDVHLGDAELSVTTDLDEPTEVSDSFVFDALRRSRVARDPGTGELELDIEVSLPVEDGEPDETLVSDSFVLGVPGTQGRKP